VGRHEILEAAAVADCAMEVEGDDLDDLFATAAAAVAELMVDPDTIPPAVERRVTLTAPALDLLLYDWVVDVVHRLDLARKVVSRRPIGNVKG
jgi:SHS2 domain-containing protein